MHTISSLIPFDMVFDVDFGILKIIQFNPEYRERLIRPENEQFFKLMDIEYADDISRMLIERPTSSPLSAILPLEEAIQKASICDEIKERFPLETYKLARKTGVCDMVTLGLTDDSDTLKFTILCDDKMQQSVLIERFAVMHKKVKSILKSELASYDNYDSIYVKNIFTIDESKPIEGKNLIIANHRFNKDEKGITLNIDILSPYLELNRIHTIDLYDMHKLMKKGEK